MLVLKKSWYKMLISFMALECLSLLERQTLFELHSFFLCDCDCCRHRRRRWCSLSRVFVYVWFFGCIKTLTTQCKYNGEFDIWIFVLYVLNCCRSFVWSWCFDVLLALLMYAFTCIWMDFRCVLWRFVFVIRHSCKINWRVVWFCFTMWHNLFL